jgi:hypothetical protein
MRIAMLSPYYDLISRGAEEFASKIKTSNKPLKNNPLQ